MANPQLENGFIKIANELQEAIMQHEFSKRQRGILDLILRLSYGCNRKHACIPQRKYFMICGLYKQDIKKELEYLQKSRVITISEDGTFYSLNKNWEQWKINLAKNFDQAAFKELLALQLNPDAEPKKRKGRPKTVSKTLTGNEKTVSKTLTEKKNSKYFTYCGVSKTLTNKKIKLVKHLLINARIRWESKADGGRKYTIYIIKDILNTKHNSIAAAGLKIKDNTGEVFTFFDKNIKRLTPFYSERIGDWLEDIPAELLLHVFKHALESSKSSEAPPLTFIDRIIKRMRERKITNITEFEAAEKEREQKAQHKQAAATRKENLPGWFIGQEEPPEDTDISKEQLEQELAAFKR